MHENSCGCEKVWDQGSDCYRCACIKQFIELHPEAPGLLTEDDKKWMQGPIVYTIDQKWKDD